MQDSYQPWGRPGGGAPNRVSFPGNACLQQRMNVIIVLTTAYFYVETWLIKYVYLLIKYDQSNFDKNVNKNMFLGELPLGKSKQSFVSLTILLLKD